MTLGRREITETATLAGGPDDILGVAQRHALVASFAAIPAEDLPPADRLFYNNAAGFWTPQRDQMLALLLRTMDRNAAASAAVQAIAVEGPSGSGKSRLVEDTVMAVIGRNILEAQTITDPAGILTRPQPLVWALGGSSGNKSFAARLCTTMGIPVSAREESNSLLEADEASPDPDCRGGRPARPVTRSAEPGGELPAHGAELVERHVGLHDT